MTWYVSGGTLNPIHSLTIQNKNVLKQLGWEPISMETHNGITAIYTAWHLNSYCKNPMLVQYTTKPATEKDNTSKQTV